jgi:hypothetical protein
MGKIDAIIYSTVLLVCLILGAGAYEYERHTNQRRQTNDSQHEGSSVGGIQPSKNSSQGQPETCDNTRPIRVAIEPSTLAGRELFVLILSTISGMGVLAGIGFASYSLHYLRKQTGEIEAQRMTMQDSLEAMRSQSRILDRQAEHLKDSVDLAFKGWLSSEKAFLAMKSKERAKLDLEIGEIDFSLPCVHYKLNCRGITPAYITSSWHSVHVAPMEDIEWSKQEFGTKIHQLAAVIPTGTTEDYFFLVGAGTLLSPDPSIEGQISKGELFIHFKLWISYKDIFDDPHTFYFYKIYGSHKYPRLGYLAGLYSTANRSPEWYDSKHKYGEGDDG